MSDTEPRQMSPQALISFQAMSDQFEFLKKQMWVTTNYLVLIYAALLWYSQHVEHSPRMSCFLSVVAVVAGLVTIGLLVWFQFDLGNLRKRAEKANVECLSADERRALSFEPYKHPYGRGWHVLVAFILVCVFGAGLVVAALN